jgi:hypothetical protein
MRDGETPWKWPGGFINLRLERSFLQIALLILC